MKVVADTMIWVSYCVSRGGYRYRLIERARRQRVRFFISQYILDELSKVLLEYLGRTPRFATISRRAVLRIVKLVDLPAARASFVAADHKDDPIVQTALSAKADYLVTADTEVLKVGKVQDVRILDAHQFDELLEVLD